MFDSLFAAGWVTTVTSDLPLYGAAFAVAALLTCGLLWWLSQGTVAEVPSQRALVREADDACVFLFEDMALYDVTPSARRLLDEVDVAGSEWTKLLALVLSRFPDLTAVLKGLSDGDEKTLYAGDPSDGGALEVGQWDGLTRIELKDLRSEDIQPPDPMRLNLLAKELTTLRQTTRNTPHLMWVEDVKGEITWANRAYLELLESGKGDDQAWPPARLFVFPKLPSGADQKTIRLQLTDESAWYDVTASRRGPEVFFFASSAAGVVKAEANLRTFTQTLSKTFAQLPIGLAVFDRDRRLVLFNPALADLTTLSPSLLATRPSLVSFLDKLREARMIPEPKSYREWRQTIVNLEHRAQAGHFTETWHLPSGATYRVTGHPHPDGAIALFIENNSAKINRERQQSSELALNAAALDALPEAIAVFSHTGVLQLSNAKYRGLFKVSDNQEDQSLMSNLKTWQEATLPTPIWGDLRDFIEGNSERSEWTARVILSDAKALNCRFTPLPRGGTMVSFSEEPFALPPLKLLAEVRRA